MQHNHAFQLRASGPALLLLVGSLLLNGCALNGGGNSSSKVASAAGATSHGFSGIVHGGQQPVVGSTVILWAAGTTGTYGTGATNITSGTTLSDGSFNLNDVKGNSLCTTGQYLYLTATGGNSGGSSNNNNIAMMAAIPAACNANTGSTSVFIDEVTTVAAVTALQQFMSINTSATAPYTGTGTVPWMIGAPSTNVVGLANAFKITPLLASITTGTSDNSFPANTVTPNNSTTPQLFTTAVVPETSKINGMADILATCINDTTGNLCTGSQGVLTLTTVATGGTTPAYSIPVDTIQAAYNMATLPNPALYSGAHYWKNSTSSTTYLSTLWANITATAPFQPYSAVPTDTTIGMNWKTTGPTQGTTGTVYAASVAVDGNGYIWIGAGTGVGGNYVTQFTPAGLLLQDIVTVNLPSYTYTFYTSPTASSTGPVTGNATQTLGYGRPMQSIAIDTNNNAWFNAYGTASPGTIATEPTGIIAEVTQAGAATGYITGSANGTLAIDGGNNLIMSNIPTTGRYFMSELSAAGSYETAYEGVGRGTAIYNGLAVDSNGYVWGFGSNCSTGETLNRANAAGVISQTEANVVLASTCAFQGAGDANGNMWSSNGTNLNYINISSSLTAPTVTVAFAGGAGTGLASVNAIAVDGAGDVWAVNKGTTGAAGSAGVAEFATSGTAGTATLLSPAGAASMGFGSGSGVYQGGPEGVAIDPSGNVWFATTGGSYLYSLIGVAAPTRTPLAANYAHIGTKP